MQTPHPPHLLHHTPDCRAVLVEEAKALYSAFMGGAEDSDGINRMDRINPAINPVNPVNPVLPTSGTAPDRFNPAFICGDALLDLVGARVWRNGE